MSANDLSKSPEKPLILRLSNNGEFADPCELTAARLQMLKPASSQLFVIFIHGWKHNEEEDDTNYMEFSDMLRTLRESECAKGLNARRVVGLYVGWPGAQTKVRLLEELTFWNRKAKADDIVKSASVTKIIATLESIRRQRQTKDDRLVYIGHSFGARMLFSSALHPLMANAQLAHPGTPEGKYARVAGLGDLVLLLNPAFEAAYFTQLDAYQRIKGPSFDRNQPPLVISISSESDQATRVFFPLGKFLSLDWDRKQRTTLGNFKDYQTHRLQNKNDAVRPTAPPTDNTLKNRGAWHDDFCGSKICLVRDGSRVPNNPFIVARTDDSIVDGHNGIWKDGLKLFISELLENVTLSSASDSNAEFSETTEPTS